MPAQTIWTRQRDRVVGARRSSGLEGKPPKIPVPTWNITFLLTAPCEPLPSVHGERGTQSFWRLAYRTRNFAGCPHRGQPGSFNGSCRQAALYEGTDRGPLPPPAGAPSMGLTGPSSLKNVHWTFSVLHGKVGNVNTSSAPNGAPSPQGEGLALKGFPLGESCHRR